MLVVLVQSVQQEQQDLVEQSLHMVRSSLRATSKQLLMEKQFALMRSMSTMA
jgi:hypothetical protein